MLVDALQVPDDPVLLRRYASGMSELVVVIQRLSMARSLDAVVEVVRHAGRRLTGADGATFVLKEEGLCHYVDEDAIAPLWKGKRFPMGSCISGWAMLNRRPAVVPDIYADARIPVDAYRPTFVKSLAMVPIRALDPIGAIGNYWASRHEADAVELAMLQALADATSVAIENASLLQLLERRVEEAREAVSVRDEFLANAAHVLRNPVNAIELQAQALRRSGANDARSERLERSIRTLACELDALLEVSWLTRGSLRLDRRRCDLAGIVREAVESFRPAAEAARCDLIVKTEEVVGEWDRRRIGQAVGALLSNAVKFGAGCPVVSAGLPVARVTVRDGGPGIDGKSLRDLREILTWCAAASWRTWNRRISRARDCGRARRISHGRHGSRQGRVLLARASRRRLIITGVLSAYDRSMRVVAILGLALAASACGRSGVPDMPEGNIPLPRVPGGTVSPSPTPTATPAGPPWGLAFDGIDDRVVVPANSAFDLQEITVEAWIYPTDLSGEMQIVSHHDHDASQGWVLLVKDQKLEFRVYTGTTRTVGDGAAAATVTANAWHHVAGTFNGSTSMSAYVDGVEVDGTGFAPTSTANYDGETVIGASAYNDLFRFEGAIDEVRLSNLERYTGATYTRPTAAFTADANTIALWHLEDAPGQAALDSAGAALDGELGADPVADGEDPGWVGVPDFADR